jgi:hypothetical protein
MNYLVGTVMESAPDGLTIKLVTGVVVQAPARADLQYRDTVKVAYDFTAGMVRSVKRPDEVETKGNEQVPEIKTEEEEIGDEAYVGELLEPYVREED